LGGNEKRFRRLFIIGDSGPKAVEAMQALSSVDLAAIKYYHFEVADFAGLDNVIISATGYTGSGGFEIYCKMQKVDKFGIKFLKLELPSESNQSVWRHVILCV
jgi:glycine cleavage system aminomethyltransferase T